MDQPKIYKGPTPSDKDIMEVKEAAKIKCCNEPYGLPIDNYIIWLTNRIPSETGMQKLNMIKDYYRATQVQNYLMGLERWDSDFTDWHLIETNIVAAPSRVIDEDDD